VACDLEVTWRRGGRNLFLRAVDLSPRGMLLLTDAHIEVPFVMDLSVALPGGVVDVLGVARFRGRTKHGESVGVSLMSMSPDENERWWAFYRAASGMPAIPTSAPSRSTNVAPVKAASVSSAGVRLVIAPSAT
jgi:hypothetical protein